MYQKSILLRILNRTVDQNYAEILSKTIFTNAAVTVTVNVTVN